MNVIAILFPFLADPHLKRRNRIYRENTQGIQQSQQTFISYINFPNLINYLPDISLDIT